MRVDVYKMRWTMVSSKKRRTLCIGKDCGAAKRAGELRHVSTLQEWNKMVEGMWDGSVPRQFLSETRDNMWGDFLWAHDPMQPLNKKAMLNACFASGLVLARYVALERMNPSKTMAAHFGARSRLVLFDSPIRLFTLRQLRVRINDNVQWCIHHCH